MADYTLSAKITADSKDFQKGMEAARKKAEEVSNELKQSSSSYNEIAKKMGITVDQLKSKIATLAAEYRKSGMSASDAMKKAQAEFGYVKTSVDNVKDSAKGLKDVPNAISKWSTTFNAVKAAAKSFQSSVQAIETTIQGVSIAASKMASTASEALSKAGDIAQKIGSKFQSIGDTLSGLGGKFTAVETAAAGFATAGLKKAADSAIDFDTQMRKVGAISDASDAQLQALRDAALELGATTSLSASEVAAAMTDMATKGRDANQIIADMPGIISAAEASGEDLALVADTVTNVMNTFGDAAGDATHIADVLAESANRTAAGVSDLQYAFKYAAPTASALGISMEELAAATGVMVDAGLQGEQAGTTLRSMFTSMAKPTDDARAAMEALGISFFDSEGKMKSIGTIVGDLQTATAGLTDEAKQNALVTIFGTEALSGLQTMMNATPGSIEEMTSALQGCNGTSAEAASAMKSGVGGAIENMQGALESFSIAVGSSLTPTIQKAAETVADIFTAMTTAFDENGFVGAFLGAGLSGIGSVLGTVSGLFGGISNSISNTTEWLGTFKGKLSATKDSISALFNIQGGNGFLSTLQTLLSSVSSVFSNILGVASSFGGQFLSILMKAFFFGAIGGLLLAGFGLLESNFGAEIDQFLQTVQKKAPQMIASFCDGITEKLPELITAGGLLLSKLLETITASLPAVLTGGAQILTTLANGFANQLPLLLDKAAAALTTLIQGLTENMPQILQAGMNVLTGLIAGISNALPQLIPAAVEMILQLVMGLLDNLPQLIDCALNLMMGLAEGLINAIPVLIEKAPEIILKLLMALEEEIPKILQTAWNLIKALAQGLWDAIQLLLDMVATIASKIANAVLATPVGQWAKSLVEKFINAFQVIVAKIKKIMDTVKEKIVGVLSKIQSAWNGLTDFVGGIFDGIGETLGTLLDGAKSLINGFISGINFAIDVINAIPVVSISPLDYLAHGTDNWQGGFAVMNEGGRGELVNLPNGSQVIPHDLSQTYAKEAARADTEQVLWIDYDRLISGIAAAMQGVTVDASVELDGKAVTKQLAPYMDTELGRRQAIAKRYGT